MLPGNHGLTSYKMIKGTNYEGCPKPPVTSSLSYKYLPQQPVLKSPLSPLFISTHNRTGENIVYFILYAFTGDRILKTLLQQHFCRIKWLYLFEDRFVLKLSTRWEDTVQRDALQILGK